MRCERLHDSAVYVLGALSPPERETYERHLVGCAECRAEVAQFADLPGLLGRLDRTAAEAAVVAGDTEPGTPPQVRDRGKAAAGRAGTIEATSSDGGQPAVNGSPVDHLLPRVLDRDDARRRSGRRRRRWQLAGTALTAACLGILAVLGVRAAGIGQPEAPDFVAMQEVASSVPVTAGLALEPIDGGTLVRMRCKYKAVAAGAHGKWTYKLVVVSKGGEVEELDSWTAGYGDEYGLKARSRIPRADIARVEIRKGDDTPLLQLTA
ncbi:zf-HC2 domain-containing protein [Dactylosporangium roseum]|uniref:Zf-HC2 domain-containing protein n=1 Tax=Dactylosporangium roseum TaxID=47989 RepID=A0ABY5Z4H0_9ACTN|nr:zf-HC2 domain-containing protein [Dactylosporangium roseum]UWZ36953.1 zf-HC2 domain-containing protein [Dactylosporangium roseum]